MSLFKHIQYKFCFIALCLLACANNSLMAQYGNEWINYSQPYWKFAVVQQGVYRIDYNTLLQSGFPVGSVNPQNIQLYARGQQLYVKVVGEEDQQLNPGDYIELYAKGNDAWLDSLVYDLPQHVPNPEYSLFNDTLHYFITYNNQNGLRTQQSNNTNFNNYTPRAFCMHKSFAEMHNEYLIGKQDANGVSLPSYNEGEGWFDLKFAKGNAHIKQINTAQAYLGTGAPQASVRCISTGASIALGMPNHHLQVGWGSPLIVMVDTTYFGYQLNEFNFLIDNSSLGNNTTSITHRSVDDIGVASDYNAVSYISVEYAHTFNFDNQTVFSFWLENPSNEDFALVQFTNVTGSNPKLLLLKEGAAVEVTAQLIDGVWNALVPLAPAGQSTQVLLVTDSAVSIVNNLSAVTPSGFFTDYTNNELNNAFVIITHPSLISAAQNYAAFRTTNEMDAMVVNVEELYMQYAAGIFKNPFAIKRFCNQLLTEWESKPSHLFLLGKSIHESNYSGTVGARNDAEKYARNLVPTWGYPGSDVVFTVGLAGTLMEPAIPTGRLAANNTTQVLEYLNKVIEQELQEPEMWQKNILHFGGGTVAFEQNIFRNYLNNYKSIAQDTCFGGKVYSFFKNTQDPIQLTVSDSIQLLINQGVSLMTFFGHASATGFDQNVDSPQSYNNQGKYPLLIGNSCYTGNIHLSESESTSENFVLVPNRGVIGFLAKSDLGIPTYLNYFTDNFYKEIFVDSYGKSIGQCMKEAIKDFQQPGDYYRENVAHTFALHGDPAVRLYSWPKPDYNIQPSQIFFIPEVVSSADPTFNVNVVIQNLGKATNDDVGVEIIRHFPNGADSSYSFVLDRVLHDDTVVFTLPTEAALSVGQNLFDVFVDYPLNAIDELDNVGNNSLLSKPLWINSGDLLPVYPYPFAVIDNAQPVLKASTGSPFETLKTYILQADTTDGFNSPMLATYTTSQIGGVVNWQLPFAMQDSMVVFWRCSADSTSPQNGFQWHESSFQYIPNETGWGQDHFFQFENNRLVNEAYNKTQRNWSFDPLEGNMKCEVYGNANSTYESLATLYQIGLAVQDYGGYGYSPSALMVAVIDSSNFLPWESNYNGLNPTHEYGNTLVSANARGRAERYFIFQQNDAAQLQGFADMILNEVPLGNYLLIYSWQYAEKNKWNLLAPEVVDAFEFLGADQLLASPDSVPFIYFVQLGHPETKQEAVGTAIDDHLILNAPLIGAMGQGIMTGPLIGPAMSWDKLEWQLRALENAAGDTTRIKLHGITWAGADYTLGDWPQFPAAINDLDLLLNVDQFPFLKLEANEKDVVNNTPPQMEKWHIMYEHAPECAMDPTSGFYINADTLQEGQQFEIAVAIKNISATAMDSMMVRYTVLDAKNNLHKIYYPLQKPLLVGEVLFDTLSIDTKYLLGLNTLRIEANPFDSITGIPHQREQFHFNNLAQFHFYVNGDNTNPILDVTFDGQHILNGDIVSTEPSILITLDDENQYFVMNDAADTSHFKIFLSSPDMSDVPVYFSSGELDFMPASLPANKCKIAYNPQLTTDGKYKLRVQASDKSGNISGNFDYEIEFEVNSKPSITEVLNYPNPFSTRTQFVFTLTGSEPPSEFKIQIMNIAGDIVREITQDELGPIRIGRNLTSYWWDGHDEFGDQLANGVYLYRVVARLNGENIELSETAASRYFTKGFGKMYLMR